MATRNPVSTANVGGHPLHPMLIILPIGFFLATLVCDLLFWNTRTDAWATAGLWMLGVGLGGAVLGALTGLIDFTGDARIRDLRESWHHAIGNVVAVVIQLFS